MALTSLPSELLTLILTHLNLKEIFAFLQTCKALYPISHRHLWSTLHLCDRIPDEYKGPPCPPFVYNPANAIGNDGCKALARAIRESGGGKLGFGYIRGLVLEPEVFNRSTACMTDGVLKVLGDRIGADEVPVRWAKVTVWGKFLEASDDPPTGVERFLKILKKYSESKSADDFSIILDTNFVTSISAWFRPKCSIFDLIDMEKITSLDLQLDVYDEGDDFIEEGEETGEEDLGEEAHDSDESTTAVPKTTKRIPTYTGAGARPIADLTRLFTETINLRILKLNVECEEEVVFPPIIKMAPGLKPLQSAFSKLRKLEWLYLEGMIFHQSFFLTPPENTRELKVNCNISISWWKKFAKSPLVGLRKFTVFNSLLPTQPLPGQSSDDDYDSLEEIDHLLRIRDRFCEFKLGEVAVEGLKEVWVQTGFVPSDLIECIQKKSRGGVRIIEAAVTEARLWEN
ncbi:hypothetical protein TWF694_001819 [Orbilia ellipsospora]|uniref:F-box domain-containing protein n=1 Tax=Orbilia ellipsospora TaxID=2528407 RepID=A0AAV9X502_9PEZI